MDLFGHAGGRLEIGGWPLGERTSGTEMGGAADGVQNVSERLHQDSLPDRSWCERRDSNSHAFRLRLLRPVRLPIPPLSQSCRETRNYSGNAASAPRKGSAPSLCQAQIRCPSIITKIFRLHRGSSRIGCAVRSLRFTRLHAVPMTLPMKAMPRQRSGWMN